MSRIALFYPKNVLASWYSLGGYVNALDRMGHTVLDCPLPGNQVHDITQVRQSLPMVDELNVCDVIIVAFAEYVRPWLDAVYGLDRWKRIKTPKILRFDESFCRRDLASLLNFNELKKWGDYYSFPAAQDADEFGGQWLTYGADLEMFNLYDGNPDKLYDLGFIGTVYNRRKAYAAQLIPYLGNVPFNHGNIMVTDLSGIRVRETTELLAQNYRQIRVFFLLPPLSQLLVMKVFETLACGTFLLAPKLEGKAEKNLSVFQDGKHLVYYRQGAYRENVEQVIYYLTHEEEREKIASNGYNEVHEKHSIEQMFQKMLQPVTEQNPFPVMVSQ